MGRFLRWFTAAALVVAMIAAVLFAIRPAPVQVESAEVKVGVMRVGVDEEGRTRIRERYIVSSPLEGRLRRITLDPGDQVVSDESTIAVIEPTDPSLLDARALAEAQARVRAAEAAVRRTEANLDGAQAAFEFAQTNLRRVSDAYENAAANERELEEARLLFRTSREDERAAEFAMEIAQFELEQAQSALLWTSADDGAPEDSLVIRSPITGEVLRVFQESVAVVTPGTDLVELGDRSDLEIVIDVLSNDAVKINPGDRVIINHWGGEEALEAVVRLVEPSAFTKISALGIEEQRVNVIADFVSSPEARASLGDGYRIEASIVIWEQDDVLYAPSSALFRDGDRWAAFVIDDGRARLRHVSIGRRNARSTEIGQGLQSGEWVILHPSDRINDGARVSKRSR